jgi:hypothetical protein
MAISYTAISHSTAVSREVASSIPKYFVTPTFSRQLASSKSKAQSLIENKKGIYGTQRFHQQSISME